MSPKKRYKFFLQAYSSEKAIFHGGIGYRDIEIILKNLSFHPVLFPAQESFTLIAKWRRLFYLIRIITRIPPHSILVFQAPVYPKLHRVLLECLWRFKKSVTLVCCLSDIDGLRDTDPALLKKELSLYKKMNHLIVHNNHMKNWVLENVPNSSLSQLEFFDFLVELPNKVRSLSGEIIFAGNLSKSRFLKYLNKVQGPLQFHIYGEKDFPIIEWPPNAHYLGQFAPYELPAKLKGSFGLVWDGDSIYGLEGSSGKYSLYNSPHKLSLYIIAGLPIICHRDSAAAALVEKYGIGITVTSLNEISAAIEKLGEKEYGRMQERCRAVAEKISSGGCLIGALKDLDLL